MLTVNAASGFGSGAAGGLATQGGVDFDGTTDDAYATFTAGTGVNSGSGPFTMAGWCYIEALSHGWAIVNIGNICIDFASQGFQLHDQGVGNYLESSSSISTGQWFHFAATHTTGTASDATTSLYVNGVDSEGEPAGTTTPALSSTGYIGTLDPALANNFADGVIAQVGVWSSVLSAAEIAVLYNSGKLYDYRDENGAYTSSADLVHYFMMNEGVGTNLEDLGTAGNDATLQGTYAWTTTGLDP